MIKSLLVFLIAWMGLCIFYISKTPPDERANDYSGHLQYLQIVTHEHRLPQIKEGWETHQPPLYYLITSLFRFSEDTQIYLSRIFTAFLGGCFLIVLAWFLHYLQFNKTTVLLVIAFIGTTPTFVFNFCSYNNEPLAILFCGLYFVLSYVFFKTTKPLKISAWMFVVGVLAIYSKFSSQLVLLSTGAIVGILFLARKIPLGRSVIFLVVTFLTGASILPWVYLKTLPQTGSYMYVNCDTLKYWEFLVPNSILEALFVPPFIQENLLISPFTGGDKRGNYWAYRFASSIFSETYLAEAVPVSWSIFWIHLGFNLAGIKRIFKSKRSAILFATILFSGIFSFKMLMECNIWPQFNFRYVTWVFIPWAVIYSEIINEDHGKTKKNPFYLMSFCVLLHLLFIQLMVKS